MKKILFFISFLFSTIISAQTGARIEFEKETINYGKVVRGDDDGKRIFVFTNTGNEPLVIKGAKSSCGCAVPNYPKDPILPGEKGEIEVKYNMMLGPIYKTIEIETNAINKNEGKLILRIKGEVLPKG